MKSVIIRTVSGAEGEQRLDRWFKKNYPELTHIQLQKLLRSGQVRVDGARAEANSRVQPGNVVRIPPLPESKPDDRNYVRKPKVSDRLVNDLKNRILYRDDDVIVLNKPAGLAVQGGTNTKVHLDGALEGLKFEYDEKPRLVHRLDRDTAGVIILARTQEAARKLAESFRRHEVRKYYWAVTLGVPELKRGRIDIALLKSTGAFEKMEANEEDGDKAVTYYAVVDRAGDHAAWVALWPITGRTHQLRAHMSAIEAPLLGDPKYGKKDEFAVSKQLHLFARRMVIPHPRKGTIDVTAPLPEHFKPAWQHFGFQGDDDGDPFAQLDPVAEQRTPDDFIRFLERKRAIEERRTGRKSFAPKKAPPAKKTSRRTFERGEEGAERSERPAFGRGKPFERRERNDRSEGRSFERKGPPRRREEGERAERADRPAFGRGKPFERKGPPREREEGERRPAFGRGKPFERRERDDRSEGRSFERKGPPRRREDGERRPFDRKGPPREREERGRPMGKPAGKSGGKPAGRSFGKPAGGRSGGKGRPAPRTSPKGRK